MVLAVRVTIIIGLGCQGVCSAENGVAGDQPHIISYYGSSLRSILHSSGLNPATEKLHRPLSCRLCTDERKSYNSNSNDSWLKPLSVAYHHGQIARGHLKTEDARDFVSLLSSVFAFCDTLLCCSSQQAWRIPRRSRTPQATSTRSYRTPRAECMAVKTLSTQSLVAVDKISVHT